VKYRIKHRKFSSNIIEEKIPNPQIKGKFKWVPYLCMFGRKKEIDPKIESMLIYLNSHV